MGENEMDMLWSFMELVARPSNPGETVESHLERLQCIARELLASRHQLTLCASSTVQQIEVVQVAVASKINLLKRVNSLIHGDHDADFVSDTMSDCMTENSSLYSTPNTSIDLAMLYAQPFVAALDANGHVLSNVKDSNMIRLKPVPALNIAQEHANLHTIFQEGQVAIHTLREVATIDSLRKVLDRGVTILHFSGHSGRMLNAEGQNSGMKNVLMFEDTEHTGLAHYIDVLTLKSILNGTTHPNGSEDVNTLSRSIPKLVFVSSCHSRDVGEVFIQAGVQHVVCVRRTDSVRDDVSNVFSNAFYHAILTGKTIYQAFEIARVRVRADRNVPVTESDKFLLLESSHIHSRMCSIVEWKDDEIPRAIEITTKEFVCPCHKRLSFTIFTNIGQGKWIDSSRSSITKTVPAVPESFVGREQELHTIAQLVRTQRFVTLRGPPGIGKTTLAIRVAHFLADRNCFSDGVIFVRLRGVQSIEGVETAMKSALFPDDQTSAQDRKLPLYQLLATVHVLFVMDNMEDPMNSNIEAMRTFLLHLLQNTRHVTFLITARQAMGGGITGFDEKVLSLNRLSSFHAVQLFLKKAPRALLLSEIQKDSTSVSVLDALTAHPLMTFLDGHPQAISLCAPLLQDRSVPELTRAVLQHGINELQVVGIGANDRSAMNTLVTSLDVSLEQVHQHHGCDAIRFFALLGLLPAGATPADFKSLWGPSWDKQIETLLRFSLIQRNRIPGFGLQNSSRRKPSMHDMTLLTALKAYGDFISNKNVLSNGLDTQMYLPNTFTRNARVSHTTDHVEKMDHQVELAAVCVSYSTFPFITSYARRLLHFDDEETTSLLQAMKIKDSSVFLYHCARHFWKVTFWIFHYICTFTPHSIATYMILEMHEANLWMLIDLHLHTIEEGSTNRFVVDVACFLAHSLFLAGRYRGAWQAVQKALNMATYYKDSLSEANARKLMGILYTKETKFDEAKAQFGLSLILYKAVGDKLGQAASLSAIGMIHARKGNLKGAHNCFTKALTLYEWFHHSLGQLNCHQRLANLEKKLRDGDGMRDRISINSGYSHHYAATRRLQGNLNRKRNGEYIVRWVGHEMSLVLELPAPKSDKVQEAHAPAHAMTSVSPEVSLPPAPIAIVGPSASIYSSPKRTVTKPSCNGVKNTPKKCRLGQIIDHHEKGLDIKIKSKNSNEEPSTDTSVHQKDSVGERLKNSSFARRKEYDAYIRRNLSTISISSPVSNDSTKNENSSPASAA